MEERQERGGSTWEGGAERGRAAGMSSEGERDKEIEKRERRLIEGLQKEKSISQSLFIKWYSATGR